MQQLLETVSLDACKTLHVYTLCCHFLTGLASCSSFQLSCIFKIYIFPWGSTLLSVSTVSTALWCKPAWCPFPHFASLEPGARRLCGSLKQRAKVETSASWPQVCGMREKKWGAAWYWCVHSWRNKYACWFFNRLFSYPGTLLMCSHILLNKLSTECDYTHYKDLLSRDFLFVFLLLFLFLNSL